MSAEEPASPLSSAIPNHWAVIHVVLSEPLPVKGEPGTVMGYYQSLGVACEPSSLRALVERHVRDGTVDWPDSEVAPIEPANLANDIRERIVPVSGEGIWYQSGRSFHGPE